MAGNLGQVPLAAHSVLQNVGFFIFPLTFGISTATTVRIGQLLGKSALNPSVMRAHTMQVNLSNAWFLNERLYGNRGTSGRGRSCRPSRRRWKGCGLTLPKPLSLING